MDKSYGKPMPLTRTQIQGIIDRFVWAAETVVAAGADGVIVCSPVPFRRAGLNGALTDCGERVLVTRRPRLPHQPIPVAPY